MKSMPEEIEVGRFSRLYGELTNLGDAVAERTPDGADGALLQEKVVCCLWFDQFLDAEGLRTADGTPLRLHWPGHWNEDKGPDFLNAEVSFKKRSEAHV